MKIIIGKTASELFKVIGESGKDITDELSVKKVTFSAECNELTEVTLTVYAEVEVEPGFVAVEVEKRD